MHTYAVLPFFTLYRREDATLYVLFPDTTLGMGKQQVNSEEESLRCPRGERNTALTSSRSSSTPTCAEHRCVNVREEEDDMHA